MNKAKYTFLLPTFKAKYFEEALNSIKGQGYTDFVCLVSDDCSPEVDSSGLPALKRIFDKVVGADPRFEYRRNKVNMGGKSLVSHWNLLVGMCNTEYFIMASDDDVYEANFLEEVDKLFKKYPKVDLLRGRSRSIDRYGKFISEEYITDEWLDNLHFINRIYHKDWLGGVASFVYKTQTLKEKGMFVDFPSAWFSDDVTNFLMAEKGCLITPSVTFAVRSSDIQISGLWGNPEDSCKKVKATFMNYKWMKNYMARFVDYDNKVLLNDVIKNYKGKVVNNIQNYIYSCKPKDFFQFLFICPNDLGLLKWRMMMHYIRGRFHI